MVVSAVTNAATFIEGIASIVGSIVIATFKLLILLLFLSIQIILALFVIIFFIYIQNNYATIINNIVYSTNPIETSVFEIIVAAYNIFAITINILIPLVNIFIQVYDFLLPLVEAIIGIIIQAIILFFEYITGTDSLACWISDLIYLVTGISLAIEIGIRATLYAITIQFEIDQTVFIGPKEQISYIEQDVDFQGFRKANGNNKRPNMNFDDYVTSKVLKFGRRISEYSGKDVSEIMNALLLKVPGTPRNQPVFDNTNIHNIHPDEDKYAVYASDIKPTFSRMPCCEPVGSSDTCLIGEVDESLSQQCPPDSILLNIITPAIQVIIVDAFIILAALAPILVVLVESVIIELIVLIPALIVSLARIAQILVKSGAVQQFFSLIFHALFGFVDLVKAACPLIAAILWVICAITRFLATTVIGNIATDFVLWNPPVSCSTQFVPSDAPFLSRAVKNSHHVQQGKYTPVLYSDTVLVPQNAIKNIKSTSYNREVLFNDILIKNPARGAEKQYLDLTRYSRSALDDVTKSDYELIPDKRRLHEHTIVTRNFTNIIRDPVSLTSSKRNRKSHPVQRNMGIGITVYPGYSTLNQLQLDRYRHMLERKYNLANAVSARTNHIKLPHFLVMAGAAHTAFNTDFLFELVGQNTSSITRSVRTFFTQYHIRDNHPIHLMSLPTSPIHAMGLVLESTPPTAATTEEDLPFDLVTQVDSQGNVQGVTVTIDTPTYSNAVELVCEVSLSVPPKWTAIPGLWAFATIYEGIVALGNLFKDIGGDSETSDACQCYNRADTGCSINLQVVYQSCSNYQEMCQQILLDSAGVYDINSPNFNQAECTKDICAASCGLCDGLVCSADPNSGFECSLCVSDIPCNAVTDTKMVLGSEKSPNGTNPLDCSASASSYTNQPGDPCYTCLGDTIVPYSTNQGCTTCGGAQQSFGDPSSQAARCKSIFNMCKCTSSDSKVNGGSKVNVPCDPGPDDPDCQDISPGNTNCTSSIDGEGASGTCSTTVKTVTVDSFVDCEAKNMARYYTQQVILLNDTLTLLRTLVLDIPNITVVIIKAGDAIFQSGAFFISNIEDGTATYIHALKNTQYLSNSIKDSVEYFKKNSEAYREYEEVFGERDQIFKTVSLSDFSTDPGKYGTYKNLLKTGDCYGGTDTESSTYRSCPYYPCCSSSPVGSNLCYPPLIGVRPFEVVNYTQELIDEFYCNLEKLNSLREDQVSSNVDEAQRMVRKEDSPWPKEIIGNKKFNVILNMVKKRNFTKIFDIESSAVQQTYFRSLDVLRDTIDPFGKSERFSEGDDSFNGFYSSILRKEDRSFMSHVSIGRSIKKIVMRAIDTFEQYGTVVGMERVERYYGRHMFERECNGPQCGSFVGDDGTVQQHPSNDEPKGPCTRARDCPCVTVDGECYPSRTDPYCCCTDAFSDPYECCKGMILCIPTIPEDWRLPIINSGDLSWMAVLTAPDTCAYVDTWYEYLLFLIRAVTNWPVKKYLERTAQIDAYNSNIDTANIGLTTIFENGPKNAVARFQYFLFGWLMFPDGVWPPFSFICAILNVGQFLLFVFILFLIALVWFAFSDVRERIFDFVINIQQQLEMSIIEENQKNF